MKKTAILLLLALFTTVAGYAQCDAIKAVQDDYEDATTMFFYKNTLTMLGDFANSEEVKELTKDIENLRMIRLDRRINSFDDAKLKTLIGDVQEEGFEEFGQMKDQGAKIYVYGKGEGAEIDGIVVVVAEEKELILFDLVGKIDINAVTKLTKQFSSI